MTIEDLCNENSFLQSLLIILLLFIIIMITLFTVIILKRDIIIIYIFSTSWGKYFFSEDRVDKDKLYDVFISYAHQDSSYVEHQLLPGLETPEYDHDPQFKCCLHSRDWLPGECIPDQILHSVENSRRTIIILSDHYLDSMWSNMEFRAAHSKALEENFQRVVIVLAGDMPSEEKMNKDLRKYIKLKSYIDCQDQWFWRKLRFALSKKQVSKSNNNQTDADSESNVVPYSRSRQRQISTLSTELLIKSKFKRREK